MSKKLLSKKNMPIILILLIALVLVFSGGLGSLLPGSIFNPSGVPMSIQSITAFNQAGNPITLISNDTELQTITFRGTAVVGDVGNETFTAQNIGQAVSNTNLTSDNTAKFIVTNVYDKYMFPIVSTGQTEDLIYTYNYQVLSSSITNPLPQCPSSATWKINSGLFGVTTKYCITKQLVGSKMNFGEAVYHNDLIGKMLIYDKSGNQIFTQDAFISNYATKTAEFRGSDGSFYGTMQYIQDTQKNPIPSTTDYAIVRKEPFALNTTKLASKTNFDSYQSKKNTLEERFTYLQTNGFNSNFLLNLATFGLIGSCQYTSCEQYLDDIVNAADNSANSLFTENAKLYYSIPLGQGFSSDTLPNSTIGTYEVTVANDIFRKPNLTLSVSAKAMGIHISVGKPQVISVTPSTITSPFGNNTPITVNVLVKNIGTGSGSFTASLDSCNAFTLSSANTKTINANAQDSITLSLLPAVQQPTTGQCSGKIYDTSKPSNFAVFTFTGTLTQQQLCIPNSYDVRGLQIWKCKSDGSDYYLSETCTYAVAYDAQGSPHCQNPVLCGNGLIDSGEVCDGTNLNGSTCVSIGYASGNLSCNNTCHFDSTNCIGIKDCSQISGSHVDEQGTCICNTGQEVATVDNKQACVASCVYPLVRVTTTQPFWVFWTTTSSTCQFDPTLGTIIIAIIILLFLMFLVKNYAKVFKKKGRK